MRFRLSLFNSGKQIEKLFKHCGIYVRAGGSLQFIFNILNLFFGLFFPSELFLPFIFHVFSDYVRRIFLIWGLCLA